MNHDTYSERLDEILKAFRKMELTLTGVINKDNDDPLTWGMTLGEAKQAISDLMLDVIGEDDKQAKNDEDFDDWLVCATCDCILSDETEPEYACICTRRNDLRSELRQTIKGKDEAHE